MGTPYTGIPGNVSLASAVIATAPADGDTDSAATFNVGTQKIIDYLEAMRQTNFTAGLPLGEGFENATFPPTSAAWSAPSKQFVTDSAWIRTTTTPLVGIASASRPVGQAASTNSSMGVTVFLPSPSRASFIFKVLCNAQTDHLDFYVDGVLTALFTTTDSATAQGGRFVTDVLREGLHTLDWRYVRGVAVAVGAELVYVDSVDTTPESWWTCDLSRVGWFDDIVGPGGWTDIANPAPLGMQFVTNGNPGTSVRIPPPAFLLTSGTIKLLSAAVAVNDAASYTSQPGGMGANPNTLSSFTPARLPFVEWAVLTTSLTNVAHVIGISDGGAAGLPANGCFALVDSTLGATIRLSNRLVTASVNVDTGIAFPLNVWIRIGITYSTLGSVIIVNGKSIPGGTVGMACSNVGNLPTTGLAPFLQTHTNLVGTAGNIFADWVRILSLRA